ncbi:MAG: Asp-tRNA(Asn)/Glu-tRNA(Gln) amidotransferase subunit GatC [Bacillota bacterium]|nr:MAG: Asp-tRNA(Asn)/Glu-tRNA(Gln) amidotransferase GatCAB subunit C [Bacillota bacterium]
MAISRAEVEHIARLARLGLSEEEMEALTEQLGRILAHMEVLRQVDTRDVPPTYHVLPLQNVLRTDTVQESLSQEAALRNAPQAEAGAFKVPKITEG